MSIGVLIETRKSGRQPSLTVPGVEETLPAAQTNFNICCGTVYLMNLEQKLILTGLNLLFLIGMPKIVDVQHAMLCFKF